MIKIGSARHDENGLLSGGKAGDQTGHEVEIQNFYEHPKKWLVFRPVSAVHAERLAEKMTQAANNPNIGYDQNQRNTIMKYGIGTNNPVECDCSSLVRQCIYEACGQDVGNITTATIPTVLKRSGLFKDAITYKKGVTLYNGDILCTSVKGHVVIVVEGNSRTITNKTKTVDELAREVIKGKWGIGHTQRKFNLSQAGFDNYEEIRAKVNELMGK